MQNPHFGSKIKIPKNMSKSILQIIYNFFVKKTAPKKTKSSRNETILKIGHHAMVLCNILTLGQKLKFQKTCQNPFCKSFTVFLCKKTAPKNTKYSRNETFLKIGHYAKAIAHAKSPLWVKKLKFLKTCQSPFYKSFTLVLRKKPLQKSLNIR